MSKKRILLVYIIIGLLWVYGSEHIVNLLNLSVKEFQLLQRVKGGVFVGFTSIFIYFLIVRREEFESVKAEKEKLNLLINSMVDFVNIKDGQGRWNEVNDFGKKLFMLDGVDYRGKKDSELGKYSPFYQEAFNYCEESDELAWQKGIKDETLEYIPIPDGTVKVFDTVKIPMFHKNGKRRELVVLGRDITERINMEKLLIHEQQKYKSLFEYNPELVYMIDLEGKITNLNSKFTEITGYEIHEFMGNPIMDLVEESYKDELKTGFNNVVTHKKMVVDKEIVVNRKDKRPNITKVSFVPMTVANKVVGIVGYAYDITKIKETEDRLMKTEKLSVVGELAASVAHEIRNPLTSLKGFVQLIKSQANHVDNMYFNIMNEELERINEIVGELLLLAKPQEIKFSYNDLAEILNSVKSLLETQANFHGAKLTINMHGLLPKIECEPNQLKQVFINIIKNSMEASAKNIELTLVQENPNYVKVVVEDDGIGMDEERIRRLGEPFYSVKEKGTGLGLTVTYRILESHKGIIEYGSEVGRGTRVEIKLPVNKEVQTK